MNQELDKIINHIKTMNGNSTDINVRYFNIHNQKVAFMFLESVANDDKISNFLGKSLSISVRSKKNLFENLFDSINNTIPNSKVKIIDNYDDIFYHLASGFTCVFVDGYNKAITLETKALLDRSVTEATSEPVLKGPKDCFIENILANMGLIRKRIKDPNLYFEETKVGRRTKTKVVIGYIKDIADEEKVNLLLAELEELAPIRETKRYEEILEEATIEIRRIESEAEEEKIEAMVREKMEEKGPEELEHIEREIQDLFDKEVVTEAVTEPVLETMKEEGINMKEEVQTELVSNEEVKETEMPVMKETETVMNETVVSEQLEDTGREKTDKIDEILEQVDTKETYTTYKVYIVRENDSLETIIEKYDTTRDALSMYNDLSELKVGDKIMIPSQDA